MKSHESAGRQRSQSLQLLVAELIKKTPDHKRIKELAKKSGMDYLEDPIEMMSLVLKSIDRVGAQQMKRKAHETSL